MTRPPGETAMIGAKRRKGFGPVKPPQQKRGFPDLRDAQPYGRCFLSGPSRMPRSAMAGAVPPGLGKAVHVHYMTRHDNRHIFPSPEATIAQAEGCARSALAVPAIVARIKRRGPKPNQAVNPEAEQRVAAWFANNIRPPGT